MDPIAPITGTVDLIEGLIGHTPHPAIVALPIGAWTVSNVCDGLAMLTGEDAYDDVARVSMAIGLVGAAGAVVTGLRDYGYIPKDRPSHQTATAHAIGNAVVGSLYAASYVMREVDHQRGRRTGLLSRMLALAGGGLTLYTAWLGGVLVEEYGEGVKPVMDHLDDGEDDEDARGRERLSPGSPLGVHAH